MSSRTMKIAGIGIGILVIAIFAINGLHRQAPAPDSPNLQLKANAGSVGNIGNSSNVGNNSNVGNTGNVGNVGNTSNLGNTGNVGNNSN